MIYRWDNGMNGLGAGDGMGKNGKTMGYIEGKTMGKRVVESKKGLAVDKKQGLNIGNKADVEWDRYGDWI